MKVLHRYNTQERQHYLLEQHYSFNLKPRLLYSGFLNTNEDWQENEHSHDFTEILFILKGHGTVYVNDEEREITGGDIIIYNAHARHYEVSDAQNPLEAQFIAFDKLEITDLLPNCLLPPHYDFLYHTGDMYEIFRNYFQTITDETSGKEQFFIEIAQNASRTLVMYLFRLINRVRGTSDILEKSKALTAALRYINEHFTEDINLALIAEKCFVNKYHLAHLFSKYQNITVGKYLFNKRMEEAKRLLLFSAFTVADVAQNAGFSDSSYFCRVFKKETGLTPRQFRKNGQS